MNILPGALAVGATVFFIFILMWMSGKAKTKKEVMFFRPRDKRGEDLEVTHETDRSILCEKAVPPHRFIKVTPSYTFKGKGGTIIRFFGIEGTAYSGKIGTEDAVHKPTDEFLKSIWTEDVYKALPQKLRDIIERDKIGITIEPVKINPEEYDLENLSSDEVNDEGDAIILNRLSKTGVVENLKQKMFSNLIWFFLGIGAYAIVTNIMG